jgi:phosphohistidine phosphatase
MRLILVRHGEAAPAEVDPTQGLSETGVRNVEKVASWLARVGLRPDLIQESGKKRAAQTAEILARAVAAGRKPEAVRGLGPQDPVEEAVEKLDSLEGEVLWVSHLPFLSRLVSRLLIGREEPELVRFLPGSAACLERDSARRWVLLWMVAPGVLCG